MAIRHRLFAGMGAALFLVTSSALTVAVIVSLSQSNNPASTNTSSCKTATLANQNLAIGSKIPGYTPPSTPLKSLAVADINKGSGATVSAGATVTADYIGALANTGVIFDDSASHGGPKTFSLNQVIAGWQQGIPGMKICGTRELLIPSSLGYGTQGTSGIPPNSNLVFIVRVDKSQ